MKQTLLSALSMCLVSACAVAQTPLDSTQNLSEVTVYASRLNQKATTLGRNVTVIAGKELSRFPINSLDDLLRCLPSLEVQSRGAFGVQADITLRGSTFNQVLILLDGMRLNDPLTGHFNGYLPIGPAEIAQIEIIRGAGSALYGPDAVGGVINIVTKTFAQSTKSDAQLNLQRGEWDLWSLNAGGFHQAGKWSIGGGVLVNTTTGQPISSPSTLRNDFDLKTYSLSMGYRFSDKLSAMARSNFDRRDFNAQWFYTTSGIDLSRETTTRNWWQGQVRYQLSQKQSTELQYVHAYSTDFYVFNPNFTPSSHRMWFSNAQLNHLIQLNPTFKVAIGGQYDSRKIESNDRGNRQTTHYGLYATATNQIGRLTSTTSLRYDNDQSYGGQLTPQLNLTYLITSQLLLRTSVGRSIRAADFTERYVSNNLPGTLSAGRNIGLANLQAEQAWNTEIGGDFSPIKGLTIKMTGFVRSGKNLIDYVNTSGIEVIKQTGLTNIAPDRTYRLAQNLFEVKTSGIETEVWIKQKLSATVLADVTLGYTHLNTENDSGVVSQYLANFAKNQYTAMLTLSCGRLSWVLSGLRKERNAAAVEAINRRLSPNYTVVNTKIEASIVPEKVFVNAQVQNLFDAEYADILGQICPAVGFWQV